jgi:hypothetical protein
MFSANCADEDVLCRIVISCFLCNLFVLGVPPLMAICILQNSTDVLIARKDFCTKAVSLRGTDFVALLSIPIKMDVCQSQSYFAIDRLSVSTSRC